MDLSIIIVNWNSGEFATKCISSIFSSTHNLQFEIIVVDNASSDESCRVLEEAFPSIKLIRNRENTGFASANNLGFWHSCGKNLMFLNPDTEVVGPAINLMLDCLNSAPDFGILGCKLLNTDLSLQTSCIQRIPNLLNQLADIEWLKLRSPELKLWGMTPLFRKESHSPAEVEAISGACLLVKRDVFERIGQFSTDYFMYMEDLDLCYKARKANYKVGYMGSAMVVHHGGQSSKRKEQDGFAAVLLRDSIYKFLSKTRGAGYAWTYRLAMLFMAMIRLAVLGMLFALPRAAIDKISIRASYRKWRKIFRWSLGLERWTRQLNDPPTSSLASVKG